MSNDVAALQTRLQAYEQREAQWKQQLQQQHNQVLALQQKLTQAGTHLKTLATENAKLQQQYPPVDIERIQALEQQLNQQQSHHQAAIESLLRQMSLDDSITLPDPSDPDQLQRFLHAYTDKTKDQDTTIQALRSQVEDLEKELKEQPAPAESSTTPTSALPSGHSKHSDELMLVGQTVRSLILDPDDFAVDTSLPPQLLDVLEDLRSHLQMANQPAIPTEYGDEFKELKHQFTQLQMVNNELLEAKDALELKQEEWSEETVMLKQAIDTTKSEQQQAQKDWQQRLDDSKASQQKLTEQLQQLEKALADQQEKTLSFEALEKECNQLKSMQKDSQSLEEERSRLVSQLAQAQQDSQTYKEQLESAQQQRQVPSDHEQQVKEWQEKAQTFEAQYTKAADDHRAALDQVSRLQHEHQSLLGRISHLKDTLAPRLEEDKQLRMRVNDLSAELDMTKTQLDEMRSAMVTRDQEANQQLDAKEKTVVQLQRHVETLQGERDELEMHAMDLDARCHQIQEEYEANLAELTRCKKQMEMDMESSASERASLLNLQSVLEEFQTSKDAEVQAAVEHIERQLDHAKKSWTEYEQRATIAESTLEKFQQDMAKTQQYEREVKEKTLLIGKLRHEAIILNEHLVEAMRRLKEETSESNVDRQLVTNLVVGFFNAPRGDRKRFDILSIIANVLQMTEEQKEQVGLIRMKANGQPGWQGPKHESPKESFTDAWISFLLNESSQRKQQQQQQQYSNGQPKSP